MISTTLGALVQADPALQTICALKLSAKSAYHLKKLAQLVATEIKHFQTERDALIKELGTEQDGGGFSLKPESENFPEFVRRVNELAEVPVQISWNPVTLEMFGDQLVSAQDLIALGSLLAEDENAG
jgi:hypothetical protein